MLKLVSNQNHSQVHEARHNHLLRLRRIEEILLDGGAGLKLKRVYALLCKSNEELGRARVSKWVKLLVREHYNTRARLDGFADKSLKLVHSRPLTELDRLRARVRRGHKADDRSKHLNTNGHKYRQ